MFTITKKWLWYVASIRHGTEIYTGSFIYYLNKITCRVLCTENEINYSKSNV